ncbi:MAG: cytochrome P450 [Vicinamibacterales bacterium]
MITAIDFSDPVIQANPYPVYARLRRETPVVWNETTGSWLVSRYDDIVALLNDPRISSARVDATFRVLPEEVQRELEPLRTVLSRRMLLTDPPTHTRLKNLVMKAFSARMSESRRERIQAICDSFIDRLATRREIEIMGEFATPLPGWVTGDVLGVPIERQEQFSAWSHDQVRIYDRPGTVHDRVAVMRRGQASMLAMKAYLEEIIDQRRREPGDDVITMLVEAEEAGDRLTSDEMVVMVVAILVGGNNSTAHLIGNAILTLLRHPDALDRLRAEPALIRPAIEEVMRYESPVQATSRVAWEAIDLNGATIEPGQNVHVLLASGNRDETQFDAPDQFQIDRSPNRHLTFAHGPHYCLGTSLARTIAQTAVLTLITRFPNLSLANEAVEWNDGFSFRSLKVLPVLFDAG